MNTLGDSIKTARKLLGYTQGDLATKSGLSQSTISDIERGRNESSRDLPAIASALNMSVEELLSGSQKKPGAGKTSRSKFKQIQLKSLAQLVNRKQGSAEVSAPDLIPDQAVAYILQGNTMEGPSGKYIPRNSTLYIVETDDPPIGKVVLASLDDAEVIGEFSIFAGKPHVRPFNQQYPIIDISKAKIGGILVGVYIPF